MRAASENLVPVTLELGGKSPAIVERGSSIADTRPTASPTASSPMAARPAWRRTMRWCPRKRSRPSSRRSSRRSTALSRHRDESRLHLDHQRPPFRTADGPGGRRRRQRCADDRDRHEPSGIAGSHSRLFPPTLLLGVTDEMAVMQEEIFGPILPVVPYRARGRHRLCQRAAATAGALFLRYRWTRTPARSRAHHLRQRRRQRHAVSTTPRTTCPSAASARAAWAPITAPKASRP